MSKILLFEIGLKAVIKDSDGKILLLKRSKPYVSDIQNGFPEKLRWDLPGGRVEPAETVVEALRREIKEETNLDFVEYNQIIDVHESFYHQGFHTVRIYFDVTTVGVVTVSEEHLEARYCDPKQLKKLQENDLLEKSTFKLLYEKLRLWV